MIDEVGDHPALLMWMMGNELNVAGDPALRGYLNSKMDFIRNYTLSKWNRVLPGSKTHTYHTTQRHTSTTKHTATPHQHTTRTIPHTSTHNTSTHHTPCTNCMFAVSTAVVDLPNSYDTLASSLHVDLFVANAGYRGVSFTNLWDGDSTQGMVMVMVMVIHGTSVDCLHKDFLDGRH